MWKIIITNIFIPILSIAFVILEDITVRGERVLSVKYRLWMFDYGFFVFVAQLSILAITFFIWKSKKHRIIAVAIFVIWILIGLLLPKDSGVFD